MSRSAQSDVIAAAERVGRASGLPVAVVASSSGNSGRTCVEVVDNPLGSMAFYPCPGVYVGYIAAGLGRHGWTIAGDGVTHPDGLSDCDVVLLRKIDGAVDGALTYAATQRGHSAFVARLRASP